MRNTRSLQARGSPVNLIPKIHHEAVYVCMMYMTPARDCTLKEQGLSGDALSASSATRSVATDTGKESIVCGAGGVESSQLRGMLDAPEGPDDRGVLFQVGRSGQGRPKRRKIDSMCMPEKISFLCNLRFSSMA